MPFSFVRKIGLASEQHVPSAKNYTKAMVLLLSCDFGTHFSAAISAVAIWFVSLGNLPILFGG
jgi:hypothetical protein